MSATATPGRIDPITAAVIHGALDSIAAEMGHKLMRMSYSSIIRESEDFGAALVDADPALLRDLIVNLVDNAVRYTPAGGRVDVSVQPASAAAGARLVVTDDGPGIRPEERARVFDRFYRRAGTVPPGSGLGLAIVKAIADAHGAAVQLSEGPAGNGLTVTVSFPPEAAST